MYACLLIPAFLWSSLYLHYGVHSNWDILVVIIVVVIIVHLIVVSGG